MEYLEYIYEKIFGAAAPTDQPPIDNTPRKIVAFGNVLLDRIVQLEDPELLQRYELELGSKGELDLEILSKLTAEASQSAKCLSNPGGSALNTVRILKKLGTDALFFGAVGADEDAEELRQIFNQQRIEARLQTINDTHTGQCICLMYEDNPTLYANIGASSRFSVDYLQHVARSGTILRPIERKQIIYIEGFFVPQRADVCDFIVKHFIRERRRLVINLSAPYIVKENFMNMLQLAQSAYFIFGNILEFEALSQQMGCAKIEDAALRLLQNGADTKIIVITKGAAGVQLVSNFVAENEPPGEIQFQNFNVPRVEHVVDATGAGDAFVAGFLHSWLEKRSLSECVRVATDVAAKVVTKVGCNLPE